MLSAPRFILIVAASIVILVYLYKLRYNVHRISGNAIIKFIIGGLLLPIHPVMRGVDDPSILFQVIGTLSQYYAMLFVHLGALQLRKNKVYVSVFKNKAFWFITLLSPLIIFLIFKEGYNLPSFSDNEPFIPSNIYYLFYILNYFIIFTVCLSILVTFNNEAYSHQEAKKAIWWYLGPTCIVFLAAGSGIMLINVTLSYLGYDVYKLDLNNIYSLCKSLFALSFGLFAILPLLPRRVFNFIFKPIEKFLTERIQRQNEMISLVHKKITPLVPGVKFDGNYLSRDDELTEIADCWLMIWTHNNYKDYSSSSRKAKLILKMTSEGQILTEFGKLEPPDTAVNEVRDSVKVAKDILRLEKDI